MVSREGRAWDGMVETRPSWFGAMGNRQWAITGPALSSVLPIAECRRRRPNCGRSLPGDRPTPSRTFFAPSVLLHAALQVGGAEVGPERFRKGVFGVGGLPKEEVAGPQLAARSDHEIGIRHFGDLKPGGQGGWIDLINRDPSSSHILGETPPPRRSRRGDP